MAILQVREINERLYAALKGRARRDKRSLSQEVAFILEDYLSRPLADDRSTTDEFLRLGGAFAQETASQVIQGIRRRRRNSKRFKTTRGLFD